MIAAIRFFELYTAINLHFKPGSKYDFFKYSGKAKVSEKAFYARRDKYFFEKCASKLIDEPTAVAFIVANIRDGRTYIKAFDMDAYLQRWLRYKESLYHLFETEFQLFQNMKLQHEKSETPLIVELGLNNTLSLEFIILLDIAYNGEIFKSLDDKNNILWSEELSYKCLKYKPFITNYWELDAQKVQNLRNVIKRNV